MSQNDSTTCFNCAYCFNHVGNKEKAKEFYTHYIDNHGNSGAVLNNLALIYESEGNTINAKVMFEKAVAIDPNNEKVISNLERITNHENEKIKEREENEKIQIQYKEASQRISFENDYVLEKLSNFIKNSSESSGFKNGKIALPEWRIPPFMQATKEKALSLKEQFIAKKYIIKTKDRNEFNSYYYEINPYVVGEIKKVLAERNRTVDKKWLEGFENITSERLEKYNILNCSKK
ncbi:MAG: hypothetical protein IPM81_02740 [Saprospirales bacterium]|nr:hypothetical protein [Saprospirales bacterium]